MTKIAKVSVITPFLNAERFLKESIDSVIAQTYEHWELLLVDDGSTDGSTSIARNYADLYPEKIHYLEHKDHQNRGVTVSRKLGIDHAQGAYIALLDSDDVWLPNKLAEQVAVFDEYAEAAMVYGLSQWWYSWAGDGKDAGGNIARQDFVHQLGVPANTVITPPELVSSFFFRQEAAIPSPSGILVRSEAIKKVFGWEDDFKKMYAYEDQALYAKICLGSPVYASDQVWTKYRQHPESLVSTMKKRGEEYRWRLRFLFWLKAYFTDQNVNDPEIWKGLKAEIWRCQHPFLHQLMHRVKRRLAAAIRPFEAQQRSQSHSPK